MKLELIRIAKKMDEKIQIYYKEQSPLIQRIVELVEAEDIERLEGSNDKAEKVPIKVSEILYFEAVDKRVFAYLKSEVYQVHYSLSEIEHHLKSHGFVRINKSTVINIYHIETIRPELNMRVKAILDNGELLFINRTYKREFEKFLKERITRV